MRRASTEPRPSLQFNSLEYVVFLLVVFALYWATVRYARVALGVLLAASLIFYGSWNPRYLVLIIASCGVDYLAARAMSRTESTKRRKRLLWTSVAYNLGVLGLFKYFNFFMENADSLASWLDAREYLTIYGYYIGEARLKFLLPVGISFFTFQSMSYTIDVYRREMEPVKSFPHYLLYVSFFPQLVAGPIVRARDLLPQFPLRPAVTDEMGGRGLYLIALGLFKKVVIADYLAVNLVDRTFGMPAGYSSLELLSGIYGYALQIYCDFSGYSDIAIGSALLLGYQFTENFNAPYKSASLQEFWRRWHISLSTWLRDYLYVSLGGNRQGPWRTYRNLLLTMLLGGLWHGAGWNFIIWGALHGSALALLRFAERRRKARGREPWLKGIGGRVLGGLVTFHFVCFTWIFFRAADLTNAAEVLDGLSALTFDTTNLDYRVVGVLLLGAALHLSPRAWFEGAIKQFTRLPAIVQAALLVAVGFGLREIAAADVVPFIYFQF